jgi:hypothetical protein
MGVQVGAVRPLQNLMHPLGICKISKTSILISPLKTCDNVPHSSFAPDEPPWLEATHFQKYEYLQDVLCSLIDQVLILWS